MLFELLKGEKKKSKSKVNILLGATFTMRSRNSFRTFEEKKGRKEMKFPEIVPKFLHFFIRFLSL